MLKTILVASIICSLGTCFGCNSGSGSGSPSLYPAHTGYSKPQGTFTIQEVLNPNSIHKYQAPCERHDKVSVAEKKVSVDSRLKSGMAFNIQKTLLNFNQQYLKGVMRLEITSVEDNQINEKASLLSGKLELFGLYSLAPRMDSLSNHCVKDENGKDVCISVEGDLKAKPIYDIADFSRCTFKIKMNERNFPEMIGTAYAFGGSFKIVNGPTLRALQSSYLEKGNIICDGQDRGLGFSELMSISTTELPHYDTVSETCGSTDLVRGKTLALINDQIQDQEMDEIVSFGISPDQQPDDSTKDNSGQK